VGGWLNFKVMSYKSIVMLIEFFDLVIKKNELGYLIFGWSINIDDYDRLINVLRNNRVKFKVDDLGDIIIF